MATDDSRRKCQAVTVGLLEEARARAQEFLRELAAKSDTTQRQAQGAFDELIDGGRKSTELLLGFLSKEVSAQLAQFGFSPEVDLETLVRRFVGFPPGPMTWRRTGEPADPAARANDQPAPEQPASRAAPGESSSRAGGEPATTRPGGENAAERHRGSSGETPPGPPDQTTATEKAVAEPAPALKAAAAKKTPGQKATARKATAKKAPGEKAAGPKKAPGKKAAGPKKAPAAGAAAKKTAGKKAAGPKKAPAAGAAAKKTAGRASSISSAPAKAAPRRESPARADAPTPAPATDQAVPEG